MKKAKPNGLCRSGPVISPMCTTQRAVLKYSLWERAKDNRTAVSRCSLLLYDPSHRTSPIVASAPVNSLGSDTRLSAALLGERVVRPRHSHFWRPLPGDIQCAVLNGDARRRHAGSWCASSSFGPTKGQCVCVCARAHADAGFWAPSAEARPPGRPYRSATVSAPQNSGACHAEGYI